MNEEDEEPTKYEVVSNNEEDEEFEEKLVDNVIKSEARKSEEDLKNYPGKPDNSGGFYMDAKETSPKKCEYCEKILFLDEPTTGLDPQAKRNLWNLTKDLNEEGMTIVLTTHNMEEAEYLCDRIAIMDKGSIIAQDTPQQLILDYAPKPHETPMHGNIEDVFLALTGHGLRD